MKSLTNEKFDRTVYKVLKDFNIPDLDTKLNSGELHFLYTTVNHLYAYQTWSTNHISSVLPKQAISNKNIDSFIRSQISHIDSVMKLCDFQYLDKQSFFHLLSIKLVLEFFLIKKSFTLEVLHYVNFHCWTNPSHYKNPFDLIRNTCLHFIDFEKFFHADTLDFSCYKKDFANSFLKMHTFFHAFNITEKRIKTSFSIQVYQVLCNLSLSKYKTKEITDTIMHHLDIDATINLRKIDNVQCIGKINLHKIYGYDAPLIPIKFLDTEYIRSVQKKQIQEASESNNYELQEILDEMNQCFNSISMTM